MRRPLLLALLGLFTSAEASTGVSCLLRTQVVSVTGQPFMQEIVRLRVLDVKDDRRERNDFPCAPSFKRGRTLLLDLSRTDMKLAYRYAPGQVLHVHFRYTDDRSGFMTRAYTVIPSEEYLQRQARP